VSILTKIFILVLLFIILNLLAIYTFRYEEYFGTQKNDISFDDNSGLVKLIKNEIFKRNVYTPSSFKIEKEEGKLFLSGIFSSQEVADKLTEILKINNQKDIKLNPNTKIEKKWVEEILPLIDQLKDYFKNSSMLILKDNLLELSGELKNKNNKELVLVTLANISSFKTKLSLLNKKEDTKEELPFLPYIYNLTGNNGTNFEEFVQKEKILNKSDIQLQINNIILKNKIIFERRSFEPTNRSKMTIEDIAHILNKNSKYRVEVAGHTDSNGDSRLNKQISQNRANRVKELLVNLGVNENRIIAIGYGNEFPIVKDNKEGLSEANNRVEFNLGE